jgi:aspartyl-tRNA(Asn)/glutamyl-tRNA(Gln) amidotransferase subunit B
MQSNYKAIIGLEIHTQLLTKTKAFSKERAEYGQEPNTHVSAVSLGHPGTLPMHNVAAVEMAVKVGIACQCKITPYCQYARKNYFYSDLPKGYQITQDDTPLCTGGFVEIEKSNGKTKKIELTRIHCEEDSGKSIHDMDLTHSLIDYNRAGTTLIEIVTEPVVEDAEEAMLFLSEVRKLVRYLEVCDGNMEEGSLRCDANISVMPKDSKVFGTKVEVKNMNSISNVGKAIEYEISRQIEALENGETIVQETRSFDANRGTTFSMRAKEIATDYRYFPEPDLPPLHVNEEWVKEIEADMPILPKAMRHLLSDTYQLNEYDSVVIAEDRYLAEYYLGITEHTKNYKAAANWLMGVVKAHLNKNAIDINSFELPAERIGQIIQLVDDGKISNASAEQKLFPAVLEKADTEPAKLAEQLNLLQVSDEGAIDAYIEEALAAFPDKVVEYKSGKTGLLGLFMGEVMKRSKGKADPKLASKKLNERLNR